MDAKPRGVLHLQTFFGSQINVKQPMRFRLIPHRLILIFSYKSRVRDALRFPHMCIREGNPYWRLFRSKLKIV